MPTALSIDSFVELVQRSRLLSADQIQQVLQDLEAEGKQVDTPEALADVLVRRDLLTSWQVGFLLKGKHNGFFLGSYRFLKMLGKGGMGAVYLAEHQMMRRRCAIKVLPSKLISDSSSVLERFYLEAQAVAALDDPNIVRAYDVNKETQGKREIHYLVMEYVDGCDLQVLVQRKGPLDYLQVADFARQAASGLAHAHECGLIHRDIKPANLLIDERGVVKILDLGLARFFDDRLDASLTTTHNESILGTADYLSPEQALDSHKVDTRTDIYSLGCTCYFMLAGHPPFPEGSVAQRLMSHQSKSPKAIEKIRPDAPADLVMIVEKMIAKSADNRYQTAREVADAFTAWLAKHADEDWKKSHGATFDGSLSHLRHEPTRAKSAATEETDLELGLAVTEDLGLAPLPGESASSGSSSVVSQNAKSTDPADSASDGELGLDQLEELDPLTPDLGSSSSSGGLDNLLNEALDNYPQFEANPNLALPSAQTGMASGIHRAAQPTAAAAGESNQLLKLILIGFAVSVPLSVVILLVSSRFDTPEMQESVAIGYDDVTDEPSQTEDPSVTDVAPPVSPEVPGEDDVTPSREGNAKPPEVASDPDPSPTASATSNTKPLYPESASPKDMTASASSTSDQPAETPPASDANENPKPSDVASAPSTPSKSTSSSDTATPDDKPQVKQSEPKTPTPEQTKALFAGISKAVVKLDREPNRKTYTYDLMVLKTAQETLERLKINVLSEPQGNSTAVLTLSFDSDRVGTAVVFRLGAELMCTDSEFGEVIVWKQAEVLDPMSVNVLGPTPPNVLRSKVSAFYSALTKDYKNASTEP